MNLAPRREASRSAPFTVAAIAHERRRSSFHVPQGAHAADLAPPADRATWLTIPEVCARLNVQRRTVQGWAKAGLLRKASRRDPATGQHVTVYHPDDVVERATERQPGPATGFLVPGTGSNGHGHSAGLQVSAPPAVDPGQVQAFAAMVLAVLTEVRKGDAQDPQGAQGAQGAQGPVYLTLLEALARSGLSRDEFRKAVAAGEVKVRGRRYRRTDVEAL